MAPPFRVEAFDRAKHDRRSFNCRSLELNNYFRERVGQDIDRRVTACFVAIQNQSERVVGFFTLSMAELDLSRLPEALRKKVPRYPRLGAARLGRLAIDQSVEGQGLGPALLSDALERVLASDAAAFAMVVDAKDDRAVRFYRRNGFTQFLDNPRQLFIPMAAVAARAKQSPPKRP